MIVTCQQCETQFQLDDSKVPDGGIRVRCSRCKCAFFVESVRKPDADHANDLSWEALSKDRPAAPKAVSRGHAEDDESDWQFNEEIAPAPDPAADPVGAVAVSERADDLTAAREAVDDLLRSSSSESVDQVVGLEGGFDLGGSDLDIGRPESDEPLAEAAEADLPPDLEQDPDAFALGRVVHFGEPGEAPTAEDSFDAGPDLEIGEVLGGSQPDLGNLEDEEFLPKAGDSMVRAESSPVARISPPDRTEAVTATRTPDVKRRAAGDLAFGTDAGDAVRSASIARARIALGWATVCLLCAHAAVVGLGPRFWLSQRTHLSGSIAGLEVQGIQGSWVENAVAGPIYVVTGTLRAVSPTPSGSLLRIRLLDASGTPIAAESAAVGPLASAEQVREWNLWDLRQIQEDGALRRAREPLAVGERRAFLAVLGSLPPSAVAFEFQAADAASLAPAVGDGADLALPADAFGAEGMVD